MPSRNGLAGIATGVLTFLWPSVTAQALVYLIAAWAILTGAFEVVTAVDLRKLVEGERQLAWGNPPIPRTPLRGAVGGNLIEHEMTGAH